MAAGDDVVSVERLVHRIDMEPIPVLVSVLSYSGQYGHLPRLARVILWIHALDIATLTQIHVRICWHPFEQDLASSNIDLAEPSVPDFTFALSDARGIYLHCPDCAQKDCLPIRHDIVLVTIQPFSTPNIGPVDLLVVCVHKYAGLLFFFGCNVLTERSFRQPEREMLYPIDHDWPEVENIAIVVLACSTPYEDPITIVYMRSSLARNVVAPRRLVLACYARIWRNEPIPW